MPTGVQFSRINTSELKFQIERKLGRAKAGKYFDLLTRFLSLKVSKPEFNKLCLAIFGKENVCLHNNFLRSILRNAQLSKTHPPKISNGYHQNGSFSLCRELPQSPRKGRTPNARDPRYKDRPSPLGPHGKKHGQAFQDQSPTELVSFGSKPPGSVEDGEEVDQAAESLVIYSHTPVRAPLGLPMAPRKILSNNLTTARYNNCYSSGELPDTNLLKKRLEQKLEAQGLKISADCVNLLNNSLDVYLKGIMKPCIELTSSRINRSNGILPVKYVQKQNGPFSASMLDFRLAMELNPKVLGDDWPTQLEKVCLRELE
ncbi:hypothetical protein ACFE04_000124 [Oxalis oulophora]